MAAEVEGMEHTLANAPDIRNIALMYSFESYASI